MAPVSAQDGFPFALHREPDLPLPIFRQDRKCRVGFSPGHPPVEVIAPAFRDRIIPAPQMGKGYWLSEGFSKTTPWIRRQGTPRKPFHTATWTHAGPLSKSTLSYWALVMCVPKVENLKV